MIYVHDFGCVGSAVRLISRRSCGWDEDVHFLMAVPYGKPARFGFVLEVSWGDGSTDSIVH